jgi:hypothetical protein
MIATTLLLGGQVLDSNRRLHLIWCGLDAIGYPAWFISAKRSNQSALCGN